MIPRDSAGLWESHIHYVNGHIHRAIQLATQGMYGWWAVWGLRCRQGRDGVKILGCTGTGLSGYPYMYRSCAVRVLGCLSIRTCTGPALYGRVLGCMSILTCTDPALYGYWAVCVSVHVQILRCTGTGLSEYPYMYRSCAVRVLGCLRCLWRGLRVLGGDSCRRGLVSE